METSERPRRNPASGGSREGRRLAPAPAGASESPVAANHAPDRGERSDDASSPARIVTPAVGPLGSGSRLHAAALRALNVAVATVALLVASPLMLLIAVAVKLESPGTVFFKQLRVGLDRRRTGDGRSGGGEPAARTGTPLEGRGVGDGESAANRPDRADPSGDDPEGQRTLDLGGRPFLLYKFRTMRVGAESETGPVWSSSEGDRRVTRVGRWLRRHRLDELPQLWNVLRGDMSVVGPRPERPSFVTYLRREIPEYPLRQRVLPGITGWAQVNRGADSTVDDVREKLHYDLEYIEGRSLGRDLEIMIRTFPVMLRTGADDELGGSRQRSDSSEMAETVGS